jgi:molybdopterin/thiamine biosynthesis adenylyltransferase
MILNEAQKRRYARNIALPEIGPEGQEKLQDAKVLVIGAGGLGSPVLLYLAAAGVGKLGVVDSDRVEPSNLQRQILFETADSGRHKTESAHDALVDLNPDITVKTYPVRLEADNAEDIIRRYDVVVDGSDNFTTRFVVNEACYQLGKTLVSGAVIRLSGQVAVFKPHAGDEEPCYQCFCPEEPPADAQPSCADNGVLGAAAGVVGSLMAVEVIKEITGMENSLAGHVLHYDALKAETRKSRLIKDKACPCCSGLARKQNIA